MLRRIRANALAKKTTIFAAVFALTCILLGGKLNAMSGEEELVATANLLIQAGQATEAAVQTTFTGPVDEMPAYSYRTQNYEPVFPFSGEYPAAVTNPIPVRPLLETRLAVADGFVYTDQIPLSKELQQYTYTRCVELGLEYELVLALMWRESRFTINAVNINTNGTQDSGIMQINDVNRSWLREKHGIDDLMDPVQNIDAGTIMLSTFIGKYGVHDGLMAYQYGEQGMLRKISQGVVTNDLITILINKRDDYRQLLQNV